MNNLGTYSACDDSATANATRRLVSEGGDAIGPSRVSSSYQARLRGPWFASFDGAAGTFTNCDIVRGPVTTLLGTLTHTVTHADGDFYLGVKIDTETHTVAEWLEDAAKQNVVDTVKPEGAAQQWVKRCLYLLNKKTTDGNVFVKVVDDFRFQPVQVLYV